MARRFKESPTQKKDTLGNKHVSKERTDIARFYGKSYFFPILLFALSVFSAVTVIQSGESNYYYYFTVVAYLGLSIFYFVKKPYLRIGKDYVSTRRMGVDRIMEAEQIERIELYDSYVLFVFKKKRMKWVFAKIINKYPVEDITTALLPFAKSNNITIVDERSEK